MCYILAGVIGGIVGLSELLQRYSYGIVDIVKTMSTYAYVGLNAVVSMASLFLMTYFDFYFGIDVETGVAKALIAGLAGVVIIRSAAFKIKANDQDYDVGFGIITNVFLMRADRSFDQERAKKQAGEITAVMEGIDFYKARNDLTTLCLTLMQNLPVEQQTLLRKEVDILSTSEVQLETDRVKAIVLGATIAKYTGTPVLKEAIVSLGDCIKSTPDPGLDELGAKVDEMILKLAGK